MLPESPLVHLWLLDFSAWWSPLLGGQIPNSLACLVAILDWRQPLLDGSPPVWRPDLLDGQCMCQWYLEVFETRVSLRWQVKRRPLTLFDFSTPLTWVTIPRTLCLLDNSLFLTTFPGCWLSFLVVRGWPSLPDDHLSVSFASLTSRSLKTRQALLNTNYGKANASSRNISSLY